MGHSFLRGSKPLEHRYEVRQGFVGKCQNGKKGLKGSFDRGEGTKL
jgi:hypothetical protein